MTNVSASTAFDEMVDALAHVQRRTLLVALLDHNPQNDSPAVLAASAGDAAAIDQLQSMQHAHLPKLADYGFIEWNKDTHEVSKGPNFDEIRPLLELLDTHRDELPEDWLPADH